MTDSNTEGPRGGWRVRLGGSVGLLVALAAVASFVILSNRGEPPQPVPEVLPPAPLPQADTTPQIPFVDVTQQMGIEFVHRTGADGEKMLPESGGAGAAFFDYDQDGDPDLLLISGRSWPWSSSANDDDRSSLALYRNDQERFTDVTDEAGLNLSYYGQGVAVGDYDADGDDDLFLTAVGANRMLRNEGGRFVDATEETGLGGDPNDWTTSAGFLDFDRDGDLDLFVCNYVRWSRELDLVGGYKLVGIGRTYAPPFNFGATQSYLYRNDAGRFVDVSAESGIHVKHESSGSPVGKALGVTFVDYDRDGWVDILVANDTVRNFLFRNRGDGTFEELAEWQRFAFDSNGGVTSGMGIDAGWFRNNEDLAVAIGNFANEMTSLFVQLGEDPVFTDEAIAAGVGGSTRSTLTFGLLLADIDLDGRIDLVQANGHLEADINIVQPSQQYRQSAQLFWNAGADQRHDFVELPAEDVGDLAKPVVGRGLTSADIDGDGDLDLLITQVGGPPLLVRNDQKTGHHWLRCRLEGPPGNPHAIGAIVELHAGGTVQRRSVTPTRSYLCQTEPIVTFGLGKVEQFDHVNVTWPDGTQQQIQPEGNGVDRTLNVRQKVETFTSFMNVSKALLENGRYDDAAESLQKALAMQPDSAAAQRNLVRARLFGGKPTEAAQALQVLMQLDKSQSTAAGPYLSGLLAMRESRYEEAVDAFRAAVQLDSTQATLRFQLATALAAVGRDEEAEQEFVRTAELDPLHGGAPFQLASYARKRGDRESFTRFNRDYQRIRQLKGPTTTDTLTLESCVYTQAEAGPPAVSRRDHEAGRFQRVELAGVAETPLPQFADLAVNSLDETGRYQLVGVLASGHLAVWQFDDDHRVEVIAQTETPLELPNTEVVLRIGNAVVDSAGNAGEATGDHNELAVVAASRSWLLRYRPDQGRPDQGRPDQGRPDQGRPDQGFEDLSDAAGLAAAAGDAARWVDLDHDGDLELQPVSFEVDDRVISTVVVDGKQVAFEQNGNRLVIELPTKRKLSAGESLTANAQ